MNLADKVSASFRYTNFHFMRIKRYFICTADFRCSLCTYFSIYGNPFYRSLAVAEQKNEDNNYPYDSNKIKHKSSNRADEL